MLYVVNKDGNKCADQMKMKIFTTKLLSNKKKRKITKSFCLRTYKPQSSKIKRKKVKTIIKTKAINNKTSYISSMNM